MSEPELFEWLWKAVLASAQKPDDPWRPENVLSKIRLAAEFVTTSDKAAMQMHDAWMAAMGGAR